MGLKSTCLPFSIKKIFWEVFHVFVNQLVSQSVTSTNQGWTISAESTTMFYGQSTTMFYGQMCLKKDNLKTLKVSYRSSSRILKM